MGGHWIDTITAARSGDVRGHFGASGGRWRGGRPAGCGDVGGFKRPRKVSRGPRRLDEKSFWPGFAEVLEATTPSSMGGPAAARESGLGLGGGGLLQRRAPPHHPASQSLPLRGGSAGLGFLPPVQEGFATISEGFGMLLPTSSSATSASSSLGFGGWTAFQCSKAAADLFFEDPSDVTGRLRTPRGVQLAPLERPKPPPSAEAVVKLSTPPALQKAPADVTEDKGSRRDSLDATLSDSGTEEGKTGDTICELGDRFEARAKKASMLATAAGQRAGKRLSALQLPAADLLGSPGAGQGGQRGSILQRGSIPSSPRHVQWGRSEGNKRGSASTSRGRGGNAFAQRRSCMDGGKTSQGEGGEKATKDAGKEEAQSGLQRAEKSCKWQKGSNFKRNRLAERMHRKQFQGDEESIRAKMKSKVRRRKPKPRAKTQEEREEEWKHVFQKFQDDGTLHHDECQRALGLCGFTPAQEWIDVAFRKITKWSSLKKAEWIPFVNAYIDCQTFEYEKAFHAYDADGSGYIDTAELAQMLRSFAVQPLPHVLQQLIEEVDEDKEGKLSEKEFYNLMDLLRMRGGFTLRMYNSLVDIFARSDKDGSGEIDSKELFSILSWLGFAPDPNYTEKIMKEVDADGSGAINEGEFVICMKKVRENELNKMGIVLKNHDADGSGTLDGAELDNLFAELGYFPNHEAIREASLEAGLDPEEMEFDLDALWRVLKVYRAREGFTAEEIEDVEGAFSMVDKGRLNEIGPLQLKHALNWLDHPFSYDEVQILITKVDVDGSGAIDLPEFRKLVRMIRDEEMRVVRTAFYEAFEAVEGQMTRSQSKESGKKFLKKAQASAALGHLKFSDETSRWRMEVQTEDISAATPGLVDLTGFLRVYQRHRQAMREQRREDCGFSSTEADDMAAAFRRYDTDNSGDIARSELIEVLEDFFPHIAHDKAMRPKLLGVISSVEAESLSDDALDYPAFLRLMRQVADMDWEEEATAELVAVRDTKFSLQEVHGFRELFLSNAAGGETDEIKHTRSISKRVFRLSLQDVKRMLVRIIPLGDALAKELAQHFDVVVHHGDQADFSSFLILMRRLVDANFAQIKDRLGIADGEAEDKKKKESAAVS
eukprot:TRINITY_DN23035_c0_g1_i1.p1 TRINITY_DN23035_c0_g1~~TRINITY_DN23035_c0_g1_i1.p1  ORF type:complete len:1110 (-),score=384.64 TRINITY_DN23035_c0_g1_i1:158-3487(-)